MGELDCAMRKKESPDLIAGEAADVANFLMFLVYVYQKKWLQEKRAENGSAHEKGPSGRIEA
jgi:hypothetical protein